MQRLIELFLILLHSLSTSVLASQPPETLEHRAFRLTQTDQYDRLILVAADLHRLDPFLYKGLLFTESRLRPHRISRKQAAGIAQLTPGGRRGVRTLRCARGDCRPFTLADALNPRKAIPAGAELLAYHRRRCGQQRMLSAYNTGNCHAHVHVFVRTVYRNTNRFRTASGLPPLPLPGRSRTPCSSVPRLPTS
jgi:soluble lytic murein transglycosylase-like protein